MGNGEKYCGDYDAFDVANEDDELEEFLGIPRKHPKVEPAKEEPAKEGEDAAKPAPAEGEAKEGEAKAEGRERLLQKALLLRKVLLLQKARPLQLLQRKHPQRSREMCDSSLSVKGGEGEAAAPKSPHCCATSPFLGRVFVEIFLCVTLSPMSSKY